MKKKKRILKKNPFIVLLIIIFCFVILFLSRVNNNIEKKLSKLGYNSNEIEVIMKKVPKQDYRLLLKKYNKSIVNLVTAKGFKEDYFSKYMEYFEKNPKSNIEDIISIINSGYDLMRYPASSFLADLVKEKYYIHKNVARYLDYGNTFEVDAKRIIAIVNSNADYDFYTHVKTSDITDNNLILVNKFYQLPDNYIPSDLVTLTANYNQGANSKMRKEAANAFMKMVDYSPNLSIYSLKIGDRYC